MADVTPHIVVPDAAAAADWYERAFGMEEESRIPLSGDRTLSVIMRYGDSRVHVGSEFRDFGIVSPLTIGGTATVLQLATDDADELWQRALASGGKPLHELADQFWGERHGQLTDPFGHRWNIAQHLRDVPIDEQVADAAKLFGNA